MKKTLMLAAILLLAGYYHTVSDAFAEDRRVALVIGNSAYKDAPLKNPVNDARAITAMLKNLGFEVISELDADRREMISAITSFGEKLGSAKAGLFYFAGHGVQSQGRNFLIPVGAMVASEADFEFETVDANRIMRQMEQARADVNIVILDACRNNPFRSIFRSPAEDGLAGMSAPRGTLVSYATSPHNVALDGLGKHSPYTDNLLKHLATPGLTVEDVFKRVREGVLLDTGGRQVTWESSSLVGNFYFVGPNQPNVSKNEASELAAQRARLEDELAAKSAQLEAALAEAERMKQEQALLSAPIDETQNRDKEHREDGEELHVHDNQKIQQISMAPKPHNLPALQKTFRTWNDPLTGMEFVWVPGGCFQMNNTAGKFGHDSAGGEPRHEVCVEEFWMGRHEVTQAQWERVMGSNPSSFKQADKPVETVSWEDVKEFLRRLNSTSQASGFRLPTEAQWEYACLGGGSSEKYCGGDDVDSLAWHAQNSGGSTRRVGSNSPNAFGLYDMSGNVWEWVEDAQPTVPGGVSLRISRGGSWHCDSAYVQASVRHRLLKNYSENNLGFRVLRTQ